MAPSGAASPPDDKRKLFGLPQELRDIIFDYAYPRLEGVELIAKSSWDQREHIENMVEATHTIRPFPPFKVNEFLVSKAFFAAAAAAYVGNQAIDPHVAAQSCSSEWGKRSLTNILYAYGKHLHKASTRVSYLEKFPKLQSISITITPWSFRGNKRIILGVMDDDSIREMALYKEMTQIRGLQSFEVIGFPLQHGDPRNTAWQANARRLGELARIIVTQPKQPATKDDPEGFEEQEAEWKTPEIRPRYEEQDLDLVNGPEEETPGVFKRVLRVIKDFGARFRPFRKTAKLPAKEATIRHLLRQVDATHTHISAADIPDSKEAILRMLFDQPGEVLAWMMDAKMILD
ncbi:Hypothetical predicted protein [Lecanosticta acicola]|uniref:Uncharacterized protein n=1 Tax=Lecanosticta acicola TaxID=111012 RepID=A0AAI9E810_9PEZI|nr:Hypothetical predicted protein [Lecanosticta acicola]